MRTRFRTLLDAKNLLGFLYAHILKFYNQRRALKCSHQRHRALWQLPLISILLQDVLRAPVADDDIDDGIGKFR